MTTARRLPVALVLIAASLGGWAFADAAPSAEGPAVTIRDFAFVPAVLHVSVGETVTWTNQDDDPHAVVANDKSFRSRVLDTGEKDSVVFRQAGEYGYFCSLHPHMTAKIIVTAP
jgi:plastocyanin